MIYNRPELMKRGSSLPKLTLTGSGHESDCYILINGVKYYTPQTLRVEAGTEVFCHTYQYVYLNEEAVGSEYTYVANASTAIRFRYGPYGGMLPDSRIYITT